MLSSVAGCNHIQTYKVSYPRILQSKHSPQCENHTVKLWFIIFLHSLHKLYKTDAKWGDYLSSCLFSLWNYYLRYIINNKFWKELIAYCPSTRHGPHRKRSLQQFLVAVGTCLPSRYLAPIGRNTDRPTDSPLIRHGRHRKLRVQKFFYCCVCIRCCGNVLTEPLASNIHIQIRRLIRGVYEIRRSDGLRCHDIHTNF
jgi:hypothetical protein